jgi:hypothetical protein
LLVRWVDGRYGLGTGHIAAACNPAYAMVKRIGDVQVSFMVQRNRVREVEAGLVRGTAVA